ncbi:MAG: DAK2 domain-containing protein [Fusobacteriaceae bacterium]|jgi:dihydroxyacetone kinase-like protein|nr:DAK2 domain-containing protein [Fusobacteriaceae bacterium]
MISKEKLVAIFAGAATEMIRSKDELTAIDAKFGDGDHGITMEKIAKAFLTSMEKDLKNDAGVKTILENAADAVMSINGGAAVPLWTTVFSGFAEAIPEEKTQITEEEFRAMFSCALESIKDLTKARIGDKTLMDALIPGAEAIIGHSGDDWKEMLREGAEAAEKGAAATSGFVSRYGRAKNYKEATIGAMDAGAVSMARFFTGMYNAYNGG